MVVVTDTAQGQQTDQDTEQQVRHGYKRVLLKLGGEMFGGGEVGLDPDVVTTVAQQIAEVARSGHEVVVATSEEHYDQRIVDHLDTRNLRHPATASRSSTPTPRGDSIRS